VDPLSATANLVGIQTVSDEFCYEHPTAAVPQGLCDNVVGEEYSPATYYVFNGGDDMNIADYTRVRVADLATFVAGDARADCPADVANPAQRLCTQTEEYQNFANWFTYYRNRYLMAIGATSLAFAPLGDTMRVGYGRINNRFASNDVDGVAHQTIERGVRTFSGTDRIDFFDWLKFHASSGPSGGTPLRKAMDDVGQYFERSDDDGPWSHDPGTGDSTAHLACRKSYHILMTDGGWNSDPASGAADSNVDNTAGPTISGPGGQTFTYTPIAPFADNYGSMLADVAMYYWNRDLRPDLDNDIAPDADNPAFWQHVVQFTIGLGVFGNLNPELDLPDLVNGTKTWTNNVLDDLWHAAVNSRGKYLSATSPTEIAEGLGETLATIAARESSEAGSSVSSISLEAGNRKFVPSYRTGNWSGDVQALELDDKGVPLTTLWKAAAQINPDFKQRPIYVGTGVNTGAVDFDWNTMPAGLQAQMGPLADEAMVNFLRGDRTFEGSAFRTRDPDSLIGDIVNSTPALIGGLLNEQYQFLPDAATERNLYRAFLANKKARPQVLFVGSNDGMVHGFSGDTGEEVFSFIPNAVLPNMYKLAQPGYVHQMMVDGPLSEGDAFVNGNWRNYLLGTLGAGGKSVFAIDVTDTTNLNANSIQWEYTDTDLGYVLQPLSVGKLKDTAGTWAAVFGNGVDSGAGAKLYIVDIETGGTNLEIIIPVPGAATNGLGGVRLVKDVNNQVVAAYAGDLEGNLWRFDLQDANPSAWKVGFGGAPFYTTGPTQAITTAPEYVLHPDGGQLVIFGTGRLFEETDLATSDEQSLYGLWDKVDGADVSAAGLEITNPGTIVAQAFGATALTGSSSRFWTSSATPIDYSVNRGWKLPLTLAPGQRVVFPAQLIRGFAFFNTIATGGEASACKPTGSNGYNILINALFGASSSRQILDTNGDGKIDEGDQLVSAYETRADGVNRILTGREGLVSIQTGTTQQNASLRGRDLTRYWRQILNPPF
ncbi:MAG: PilC/PilY family type IV pilus protein, partial [Burkholderiaceae bacterium]